MTVLHRVEPGVVTIREHVDVIVQLTVVRLEHLARAELERLTLTSRLG